MSDKTQFYWAVVGDANPEPVAVTTENGKRVAYTIGCADPFDLDGDKPNIRLIPRDEHEYRVVTGKLRLESRRAVDPLPIPKKPEQLEREYAAAEKRLEADRKKGIRHSWRRLNP